MIPSDDSLVHLRRHTIDRQAIGFIAVQIHPREALGQQEGQQVLPRKLEGEFYIFLFFVMALDLFFCCRDGCCCCCWSTTVLTCASRYFVATAITTTRATTVVVTTPHALPPPPYNQQVYFRAGVLEQLEEERGTFVRGKVVTVQRALMGNAKRRPYLRLRNSAIVAQKLWR